MVGAAVEFLAVPELFLREGVGPHGRADEAQLIVVVNNRLAAQAEIVPARLSTIVERSLSTLIRSYERQSAERVLAFGRSTGLETRIAAIAPGFAAPSDDWFDPSYMRAAYAHGFEVARAGRAWHATLTRLLRGASADADADAEVVPISRTVWRLRYAWIRSPSRRQF